MSGIRKSFGSTQALRHVDLALEAGEIHALVGENGAGKSTLMKILSGAEAADDGRMFLEGEPFAPRDPLEARQRGVAMIYQELTLAPHLTVEANIALGREESTFGWLRPKRQHRRVREVLETLEHPEIRPDSLISDLSPAARQLVEIARALLDESRLLVLDEPTSSLSRSDVERLFRLVRRMRDGGATIVHISHFLEEVEEIADRLTVLRDGVSVATESVRNCPRHRTIELMVGRRLEEQYPRVPHEIGAPILEVLDLAGVEAPRGVSLSLRRGEILGLAGIVGAGRTELLRAIFGLEPVVKGEVRLASNRLPGRMSPSYAVRAGMGLLSEDRKTEGLALSQSLADNLTYSRLRPYASWGFLRLGARRKVVRDWLTRLAVRCQGPDQVVEDLSGGNQQKVAIGRLLHQDADVLLLDEPTRGVDLGSKVDIYRMMGEQAARGKAILFVSSYLPELLGICDRVGVVRRGRLGEIRPAAEWTPERIMAEAVA